MYFPIGKNADTLFSMSQILMKVLLVTRKNELARLEQLLTTGYP